MSDAYALQIQVESPTIQDGLRIDHPDLRAYTKTAILKGWNNERVCKVIGVPQEFVDKVRHSIKKNK